MATVDAIPRGGEQEYKALFRNRLILDFCQSFKALEVGESENFSAPTEESIESAWELLCRLNIRHVLPTRILPSPEGGVALCFSRNGRYADFECFNAGNTMVAMSDKKGKVRVFAINLTNEKEVDDVILAIGQFLDPIQDALPFATACR